MVNCWIPDTCFSAEDGTKNLSRILKIKQSLTSSGNFSWLVLFQLRDIKTLEIKLGSYILPGNFLMFLEYICKCCMSSGGVCLNLKFVYFIW